MYAGTKDRTLLPMSLGVSYPEDLVVYEGEPDFADLLDDDLDLDLDDDEDLLFDEDDDLLDGEPYLGGVVSWEDFGLDALDAVDAGFFDEYGRKGTSTAAKVNLVYFSILTAGIVAALAGPRARVRRNARQMERRIERYCKLVRKGKGKVRQKALLRRLGRDVEQYSKALGDLENRLNRRRKKDKATLLLAEAVKNAKRELKKLKRLVQKADQKLCQKVTKKKSSDEGSTNMVLYGSMDDDQILMDVVGISQDDLDFLEAFGADPEPSKQAARKEARKAAFQKTSTYFRDLLQQLQSKAERAKLKAAALERRAAEAARRSEVLALRSQEQGDLANRLERLESRSPQAPASPTAPKLSTGAMVGIGVGVAALAAGLTYMAVNHSRRG
jgi:hypothetical protein